MGGISFGGRKMIPAAYFDLDRTLLPQAGAERLFVADLFRSGRLGLLAAWRSLRMALTMEAETLPERWKANKAYTQEFDRADFDALAERFAREKLFPRLAPTGLAAVAEHRRRGHRLVLLTGCLEPLARPLADQLGLDDLIAARLETRSTKYLGRLVGRHPYGPGKRELLIDHARSHDVHLGSSFVYADSLADLEILRLVGHPRPVNPDRRLRRVAQAAGWKILGW